MTVAFQSFGRSPMGAFIRSPLGARDAGAGYDLLAWRVGSSVEMHRSNRKGNWAKDTVNNNTNFENRFMKSFVGGAWREMWGHCNERLNDAVLTRTKNVVIDYSGELWSRIIDIDGRLGMTLHAGAGVMPKFYYSDNDGDSWSSVNLRSSVAENSFRALPILLKLASGRLVTFSRNYHGITSPIGTNFFCEYSDDDGANWTEVLVYNYSGYNWDTTPGWAWVTAGGRIVLVGAPYSGDGKKTFYSDDDGATWSSYNHDLPNFWATNLTSRQVHVMDSGRVIITGFYGAQKVWYTTNGGQNFSELGGGPLLKIKNKLYRFKNFDAKTRLIEMSDDEGDTWSDYDTVSSMSSDDYGFSVRSKFEDPSFL
jgi:hypothetical protein